MEHSRAEKTAEEIDYEERRIKYKSIREEFENEWIPPAIAIGISWWEFWDMNPKILKAYAKAHEIKQKRENWRQWAHNSYTYEAILVALDHGFNGSKASTSYPKVPHGEKEQSVPDSSFIEGEEEKKLSKKELDEKRKAELLFARLEVIRANSNIEQKMKELHEE